MGILNRLFINPIMHHSNRLAHHLPTAVGSIGEGKRRALLRRPRYLIKGIGSSKVGR